MTSDDFLTNLFDIPKLNKFYKKHQKKCGNFTEYNITRRSSGIGAYVKVQCNDCLEDEDVSDYNHW